MIDVTRIMPLTKLERFKRARIALLSWYAYYNGTIYDHNRADKAIHIRQLRRAKALPFVFINQVPVNLTYAMNIICMSLFGINIATCYSKYV